MSKFKKVLSYALVIAMTAGASFAGTYAYLTSEDSDVNVMTLGNVKIEQHELQRKDGVDYKNGGEIASGDELETFVQGQTLYPSTYTNLSDYTAKQPNEEQFWWGDYVTADVTGNGSSNGLWDDKLTGAMDKFVFVENTGKSDAYYRTIIAFECPEGMEYSQGSDKEFMMNVNSNNRFKWEEVGFVTINDVRYLVMVATYNKVLEPGTISRPSLLQVVMTHNATNEDMELLGDTYDILVLSQAVQTAGFEDAQTALDTGFGDATVDNVQTWFGDVIIPVIADSAEDVADVLGNGGEIILEENISADSFEIADEAEVTVDLAGQKISTANGFVNNGDAVIENGTLENSSSSYGARTTTGGNTTYNDVIVVTSGGGVNVWGTAVWNDGSVTTNSTSTSARHVFYVAGGEEGEGHLTINGGEFTFSPKNLTRKGSYICAQGEGATVIVNDGIFNKPSTRTAPIQALDGATVTIYGGTFAFDPSAFVAEGYQVVESDGWWTVSAK